MATALATQRRWEAASAPEERLHRRTLALLRARASRLYRSLPKRQSQALRLVPVLLQANFNHPAFKGDPPGVEGLKTTRAWSVLSLAFDLPTPIGSQRGPRLISGLTAVPIAGGVEVLAILAPGIGRREAERTAARIDLVDAFFQRLGVGVRVRPSYAQSDAPDVAELVRHVGCGALIAGSFSKALWERVEQCTLSHQMTYLWQSAPTSLSSLLLVFHVGRMSAHPCTAVRDALLYADAEAIPPWRFADPELFCALWAAPLVRRRSLPFELVAAVTSSPLTRRVATALAGQPTDPEPARVDFDGVLHMGHDLAREVSRAVMRASVHPDVRAALRAHLRREVLELGFPVGLFGVAQRALLAPARKQPPFALRQTFSNRSVEIRTATGSVVARGATPEQAWVRALALFARLQKSPGLPNGAPAEWKPLVSQLREPAHSRTLVFVVDSFDVEGAPHDPLNRGVERQFAFNASLCVELHVDSRPTARRLTPEQTVHAIVHAATTGAGVRLIPATGSAEPVAARLTRLAHRLRQRTDSQPLVVEAGGRVFMSSEDRVRSFAQARFLQRPRRVRIDPEAPDFGSSVAAGRLGRSDTSSIECVLWAIDEHRAHALYRDAHGYSLREELPLERAEAHLAEVQQLLRAHVHPVRLATRVGPEVAAAAQKRMPLPTETLDLTITGTLPFGVVLEVDGERFGAGQRYGVLAAAQALLSHWPVGIFGHLRVQHLSVDGPNGPLTAIARVYVRSMVLRRVWAHIRSATRP